MLTRNEWRFLNACTEYPNRMRIIAEGDSWVSHPLPRCTNLAVQLHRYLWNAELPNNMLSTGKVGDLLLHMGATQQLKVLKRLLSKRQARPDILFLSAGGNDILYHDDASLRVDKLLKAGTPGKPKTYICESVWKQHKQLLKCALLNILALARVYAPRLKIVMHTYDAIYPREKGAEIPIFGRIKGPWVWPYLENIGVSPHQAREAIRYLLGDFYLLLTKLSAQHTQLEVINTLGTLPDLPDWRRDVTHWDDEIHPNKQGFALLTCKHIGPRVVKLWSTL